MTLKPAPKPVAPLESFIEKLPIDINLPADMNRPADTNLGPKRRK